MCNAQNHPRNCRCGWGGDGHKGKSLSRISETIFVNVASYTSPNASCPVCGAAVFFYRSPSDGRVFFDTLGPPWPKHPCTDKKGYTLKIPVNMAKQTSMHAPLVGARARHNSEGWAPLIIVRRGNIIIAGGSRTTITCNFEGNQLQLLVSGKKFPFHGVFFAKTFENGKYQISVMQIPEGLRKPHISIFSALLNDGSLVADPELVARPPKAAKTVKKGRPQSILIKIDDPRHPNFRRRISRNKKNGLDSLRRAHRKISTAAEIEAMTPEGLAEKISGYLVLERTTQGERKLLALPKNAKKQASPKSLEFDESYDAPELDSERHWVDSGEY